MRRRLSQHARLLAIALVWAAAALWGVLGLFEGAAQTLAVRLGATARPAQPDDPRIVVLGIDDQALDRVYEQHDESWPWPRTRMAELLGRLDELGARTIVLDVVFRQARDADEDEALRAVLADHGNTVLAARLASDRPADQADEHGPFVRALELLDAGAIDPGSGGGSFAAGVRTGDAGVVAIVDAHAGAITGRALTQSSARVLRVQAARALDAARAHKRLRDSAYAGAVEAGGVWPGVDPQPTYPTETIGSAAALFGNSDVGSRAGDADGVVRRVPLWVVSERRAYPLLGLSGAMLHAGLTPETVTARRTVFAPGGLSVPTASAYMPGFDASVGGMARVSWPVAGDWREQFPQLSAIALFDEASLTRTVTNNLRSMHDGADFVASIIGGMDLDAHAARAGRLMRLDAQSSEWNAVLGEQMAAWQDLREEATRVRDGLVAKGADATDEERQLLGLLGQVIEQTPALEEAISKEAGLLRERREQLEILDGALVFLGSVATKAASDMVPTSIDSETPGVFVHAAIARGVLTGTVPRDGSPWVHACIAGLAAIFGYRVAKGVTQIAGALVCLLVGGVWFVAASWVIRGEGGVVLQVVHPFAAMGVMWLIRSSYRAFVEQRDRRRTEARFKAYVAPEVVDILVNNPDLSTMEPQRRELTILFSDIAGFTTISETLGTQATTEALSEYLREMTEVLQETGATLDKYLGDGIMAFWGAPIEQDDHGPRAARAALEMFDRLDRLNERGVFGSCGPIDIRVGLATGVVSVGDFGNPPHRTAYTVIGDTVNLSARLESANKQVGRSILINGRLAEILRESGGFEVVPVGPVRVVGKNEPEPISSLVPPGGSRSISADRRVLLERLVGEFSARSWDGVLACCAELERDHGDAVLAGVYRDSVEALREAQDAPLAITLEQK